MDAREPGARERVGLSSHPDGQRDFRAAVLRPPFRPAAARFLEVDDFRAPPFFAPPFFAPPFRPLDDLRELEDFFAPPFRELDDFFAPDFFDERFFAAFLPPRFSAPGELAMRAARCLLI